MRKRFATALVASLLGATIAAAPASADFGLHEFEMPFLNGDGSQVTQPGSHPFEQISFFRVNSQFDADLNGDFPEGDVKQLRLEFPPGFVGDPLAMPRCSTADYLSYESSDVGSATPACPDSTVVGIGSISAQTLGFGISIAIFNLEPPPGVAARLGFVALDTPVTIEVGLNEAAPHNVVATVRNVPQRAPFFGSMAKIWGVPGDPAHDALRGTCRGDATTFPGFSSRGICSVGNLAERPFLTMPRSCTGPLLTRVQAISWRPGDAPFEASALTPVEGDCSQVGFEPTITSQATTRSAESPSGLSFELELEDEGLKNPSYEAVANSDVKQAKVTLPEGVTINPSQAIGLATCTPAQFAAEKANSAPGAGCPEASKVGSTEVETPLLEGELLKGSVYVAQQDDPATPTPGAENPFDSLIALYMTVKSPRRGINVGLAGKVEPHPVTGQIVTTFGHPGSVDPAFRDLPQLPFSNFRVRLREGGRSPLVTPPTCGEFQTEAEFTPWANPNNPVPVTASTQITSGVGGGPCPPGGAQPFEPGFEAGTINNSAGAHSPFAMRLTRRDGDRAMTRFDATLPAGMLAKLAGVTKCPDAAIAAIKAKTGKQELAAPSCPANSRIGGVFGGAGAGSQLVYVPGSVYLAGPFGGAPLSVVGVVPAVAGPFDVGVVMTRQALVVDRITGIVKADGALSEPIPHILAGIPLRVRDIQVSIDRPEFTLNPTSCEPMATVADIWGAFAPAQRAARFQAADCARLGFKPHLRIDLRGGTRRGANPALRAVLRPKPGNANIEKTIVRLPRSAFLDQAHIKTICTRVQWAQDSCPPNSRYGRVVAHSPLLDEPLRGPAYLRSSNNLLPDLVFDLRGEVNIESGARIDSIRGGIRAIFAGIPDAPLDRVVVNMAGGKRSLIVNSRNLCDRPNRNRANVRMDGHNGAIHKFNPVVRNARCGKARKGAKAQSGKRQTRVHKMQQAGRG